MTTAVMPGRRVRRFDVVGLRVYGRDDLPGSRARLDHRVSRTGFGSARWPLDEAIDVVTLATSAPRDRTAERPLADASLQTKYTGSEMGDKLLSCVF